MPEWENSLPYIESIDSCIEEDDQEYRDYNEYTWCSTCNDYCVVTDGETGNMMCTNDCDTFGNL